MSDTTLGGDLEQRMLHTRREAGWEPSGQSFAASAEAGLPACSCLTAQVEEPVVESCLTEEGDSSGWYCRH
jgi:hypothetical protein